MIATARIFHLFPIGNRENGNETAEMCCGRMGGGDEGEQSNIVSQWTTVTDLRRNFIQQERVVQPRWVN